MFNFYQYKNNKIQQLKCKSINPQLKKFTSAIENESEEVLRLSPNMIGDNKTDFPHKFLLTNRQVLNLSKAFANHSSADIKLILSYQKPNYQK